MLMRCGVGDRRDGFIAGRIVQPRVSRRVAICAQAHQSAMSCSLRIRTVALAHVVTRRSRSGKFYAAMENLQMTRVCRCTCDV